MQDYEAEIWSFKYRIELSTVEASRKLYLRSHKKKKKKKTPLDSVLQSFNDIALINERELLIRFNNRIHVLRCDIDGKFLGYVKSKDDQEIDLWVTNHYLRGSVIPLPLPHEMRDEDGASQEPPFFVGL